MEQFKVIELPLRRRRKKETKKVRNIDGPKYFNAKQIKLLRKTVRDAAELDYYKKKVTAVREWMIIDLLTSTGLRVSEAADVRCGDFGIGYGSSKLSVKGKGGVIGHVVIPGALKNHLKQFLRWKKERGEGTQPDDFLFIGQRGPMTAQAIQQIVKKYLRQLNLYELGKSVHSIRHSYAVELYGRERDLRTVQKQLRHVSIQSTLIYADVTDEQIGDQLKGLWG